MRRGGGAGPHAAVPTAPTTAAPTPFPQCSTDILQRMAKAVRLSGGPGKPRSLAQFADWQPQIDNELFCLTQDEFHLSTLTPIQRFQLLEILARFFKEKADDPHRYTYFEVIFLGREADAVLHEQRMEVLLNFSSFALQYPVLPLFTTISQWLSKDTTQRAYAEKSIALLVDHFVRPAASLKMYEFLLPLESKCPEFITLFITLAHTTTDMSPPLALIYGKFMQANVNYMLSQFRDEDWMAEEFAFQVFPKCLAFILSGDTDDDLTPEELQLQNSAVSGLCCGLLPLIRGWSTKVKKFELDFEPLFEKSAPWSICRSDLFLVYGKTGPDNLGKVSKYFEQNYPPQWVASEMVRYLDLPLGL